MDIGQKRLQSNTEHNPFTYTYKCQGRTIRVESMFPGLPYTVLTGVYMANGNNSRELDPMFEPNSPAATLIAIVKAL